MAEDDTCTLGLALHLDDDDERWMYVCSELASLAYDTVTPDFDDC